MDSGRRRFLAASAAVLAAGLGEGSRPSPAEADVAPAETPPAGTIVALVAAQLPTAPQRLSYDGSANGPVLRLRRGAPLTVAFANHLGGPTALQWHGLRGPGALESSPDAAGATAAGAALARTFVPPDSGLFWFHAAALPGLPDQTAAGLRGVLIVDEAAPPTVDCDLLLTLSDAEGAEGAEALTVNGAPAPVRGTLVSGGRLRLRLLNASTSRILILAIEGARPKIVAIDGQPSELFEPVRDAVPAGPGARFELMLDAPAAAGSAVCLLSRGLAAGAGPRPADVLLMALTTEGSPRAPLPPIAPLPPNPALPPAIPLERSARATLLIEPVAGEAAGAPRWRLNGVAGLNLPARPLLTAPQGGPVTLGFDNRAPVPVPLRVHGHAMRLLHPMDDGWEPYWRDSVILAPASVTHVAFVADTPGRWLIDSAVFDQAASGLRTWFTVT